MITCRNHSVGSRRRDAAWRPRVCTAIRIYLHVFSVIAFGVGDAEQPLLHDRVDSVRKGDREAEALFFVGNTRETSLAPTVSARAGLVMREEVPVSVRTIVFGNGPPLTLAWLFLLASSTTGSQRNILM